MSDSLYLTDLPILMYGRPFLNQRCCWRHDFEIPVISETSIWVRYFKKFFHTDPFYLIGLEPSCFQTIGISLFWLIGGIYSKVPKFDVWGESELVVSRLWVFWDQFFCQASSKAFWVVSFPRSSLSLKTLNKIKL